LGKASDYVPIQLTKAFREAQSDEKFQGWLKMQDAVMGIEFPIYDLPEVRDSMYTKESLAIVEEKLLSLYDNSRDAFDGEENVHRTMRFAYYIGETYRRAFEGTWVAIPTYDASGAITGTQPGIQVPFREDFIRPVEQVSFALIRRTGNQIGRVYGHAERDYNQWIEDGRPGVKFVGTLREDD
jgi:hypothetical protein